MSAVKPTHRQAAWRRSPHLPEIGRAQLREINAARANGPVCGAKAKSTGEPCQQPALENGRCRIHGGLTPKGDQWHKPRWPAKDSARFEAKLARKLASLAKRQKAKDARVAAMTPEERAKFDRWHRHRKPGSAVARAAACERIRQDRDARESTMRLLNTPEPVSDEGRRLAETIRKLEEIRAWQDKQGAQKHDHEA